MDCSGVPLKTSSQEEHARLSTILFELCSASASQALCLRGRGRAKLKEFCTQRGTIGGPKARKRESTGDPKGMEGRKEDSRAQRTEGGSERGREGGREGRRQDRRPQATGEREREREMGMDGVAYAGGFAYAVWEA